MALSAPPTAWLQLVNQPQTEAEVAALRCCVNRGRPFGDPDWVTDTAKRSRGSNARFGPVEDRRNNRRLATFTCTLQIWWLSPFTLPEVHRQVCDWLRLEAAKELLLRELMSVPERIPA